MSRIGKLPIPVPAGVDVTIDGRTVAVKGPKGSLSHTVAAPIEVAKGEDGMLIGHPPERRASVSKALHGLSRTLVANMITGVTAGYSKALEISGVGYRVQAKGSNLEFSLGYSHPILVEAPEGISFKVESPTKFSASRASTSRRSARSPRTSASCGSPTRTRPRASSTRARSSAARSERLVSSHGIRCEDRQGQGLQGCRAQASPHPRPQADLGYGGASAPGRDAVQPWHRRAGHRRHRGPHAGVGVDPGRVHPRRRRRQERQGEAGRRSSWPSVPRPRASRLSCSTVAATSTPGASPPWRTPPAKPG